MAHSIDVVAAVLRSASGGLLVAQRPASKRHGGLWEFPGGKIDPGESMTEAIRRELREELALETAWVSGTPLYARHDPGQPFRIIFLEVEARGHARLLEHQALAWIGPPWTPAVTLAPTDAAFVSAVRTGNVLLPPAAEARISPIRLPGSP
jgi:8-oxo-dGTP pyrophosphatase MutT (NUDIX family)